ncbi:HlyD family secretion protein [Aporhodopirellula aestuarii]|uniref:Efflux RND transporter periplasmic adaptor subunit n=1 Tax=Aporhodopirellula aestuarii TaxID=2950107 RepID=A0ABT0TYP6_9BACT|nr:efflux RND transporter periplasmic adaptor subunit [Aporhodopirellula aestuarii]MCM2369718.1 efflux RND transporter periplasmic adaptor subunit [Aporhodopirellula aestuarii]
MTTRIVPLIAFVCVLLGLIAYSKWDEGPIRVSGFIEADEIRLGSRLGGRVAQVHVEEGQEVTADMVLVELEPYDLLEREKELELSLASREAEYRRFVAGYRPEEIAQAKANLAQLQARLDLLRAGPRKQEIEAARARLSLAEAERRLAEENEQRLTKLARSNATSEQERDAARERLEAAIANVEVRRQELALLDAGTREEEIREAAARTEQAAQALLLMENGYRREEVEKAEASRDAAQAALDAIRKQKQELKIKSPTDGTVEALDLQPGDMVAAGAPVLSILDRSNLWVRAYIPQNRVAVKVGQTLPLSIDSFHGEVFEGVVVFVARQSEFTPSNVQTPEERSQQVYRIKITIQDSGDRLRPGMTADVWLDSIGESK